MFRLDSICFIIGVVSSLSNFSLGFAQDVLRNTVQDSLRLHVVYPMDGDTLNFDRIRYAGSVLPDAQIWVRAAATRVYPSGAFVGMVELQAGFNTIVFSVQDKYGILSDSVKVFRRPEEEPYPEIPTAVDPRRIQPAGEIYISPGETLEVEFRGSPKGSASFSLDKIAKDLKMHEVPDRQANGLSGLYRGTVLIPHLESYSPKAVEFKFRGRDGYVFRFSSIGKIHLLSPFQPLIGVTSDSSNLVLTKPDGDIQMELPAGLRMQIVREQDNFRKIRLAKNVEGFLESSSLRVLPPGSPYPYSAVGNIFTLEDGEWIQLWIDVTEKVPFQINQMVEPATLEVLFFRSVRSPQWVMYPHDDESIKRIQTRQKNSDILVLRVELNQKQQWGYRGGYEDDHFILEIRKRPRLAGNPDSLLRGLIIAVDPGHGGESEGGVSATGLQEKTLNLNLSKLVRGMLIENGAKVLMTRTTDTTLTLQSRVEIARRAGAHILISLHSNSIEPDVNPLKARGTSTYYTIPQSQQIAKVVYERLLDLGLYPFGRIAAPFVVTRQTDMIALLVEGAFLTHPEDEILLMDKDFVEAMARAVVDGIKDFALGQLHSSIENQFFETENLLPIQPDSLIK